MARGRKPIPVDRALFQNIVRSLEKRFGFTSRQALWQTVAKTGWAKSIGLSAQVAMLKAEALDIEVITPKGQPGFTKGANRQGRPKGSKSRHRIPLDVVVDLKKMFHPALHSKVDKAAAGSLRAAVALNCIDCSGGSKKEVSLCKIKTCPLWAFRPYQDKECSVSSS